MKSKISKDAYHRLFMKHKIKLLQRNFSKRWSYSSFLDVSLQKFVYFSFIRNRCFVSSKGRAISSLFCISSNILRSFARVGKLEYLSKASWLFLCVLALVVESGIHDNFKVYSLQLVGSNPTKSTLAFL